MSNSLLVSSASLDRHTSLLAEGRVGQHQLVYALLPRLVRAGRLDKLEFRGPVKFQLEFLFVAEIPTCPAMGVSRSFCRILNILKRH
jgi:hypothetical protein